MITGPGGRRCDRRLSHQKIKLLGYQTSTLCLLNPKKRQVDRIEVDGGSGRGDHRDASYTSQICTPCLSDANTSGRAGRNSCATCPLKPVSTMAFITAG